MGAGDWEQARRQGSSYWWAVAGRPWVEHAILIAILAVAAFLRAYRLAASSLWSDEGNTWALVGRGLGQITRDAAADIHPPGYYWLLKGWTALWGGDVAGMRSFSVVAGVALVLVVYRIGGYLEGGRSRRHPDSVGERISGTTSVPQGGSSVLDSMRWVPLLAAFLAAVNPFQIYYSQEARMYGLLALEAGGLFWALLAILQAEERAPDGLRRWIPERPLAYVAFVAWASAGLWTHYSFPVLLAAAGAAYLLHWFTGQPGEGLRTRLPALGRYLGLNLVSLLAFLPWLPIAFERVLHWPKGGQSSGLIPDLHLTLQTLGVGPIRSGPELNWPWLALMGMVPLLGWARGRRQAAVSAIGLWWLAPIAMMFGLGLFSDAFLKFLLAASPAWFLLAALAGSGWPGLPWWRIGAGLGMATAAVALAVVTLPGYYVDPAARDNYAGVARTVSALGDPATDLVLLDAPGQQEVWAYYDPGLPLLALPHGRPPDPEATEDLLARTVSDRSQIFALFWAEDEADPGRIVEGWLDRNAFKGLESWQGNLRFVIYSLPNRLACAALAPPPVLGERMALVSLCRPEENGVAVGEPMPVSLHWQARQPIDQRYKVTVQLLDARGQVVSQRDGEPVGGTRPTDGWAVGETIVDNHAVFVAPGTPPGHYRLLVAVYAVGDGKRLLADGQDHVDAGIVVVEPPAEPLPPAIVPMQRRINLELAEGLQLVGYDVYRRDYGHAPDTLVQAGDLVHVTLYWQGPEDEKVDRPQDLAFTLRLGEQSLTAPLAGGHYPLEAWQPGELVRAEFDIPFGGGDRILWLELGEVTISLGRVRG